MQGWHRSRWVLRMALNEVWHGQQFLRWQRGNELTCMEGSTSSPSQASRPLSRVAFPERYPAYASSLFAGLVWVPSMSVCSNCSKSDFFAMEMSRAVCLMVHFCPCLCWP